MKRHLKLKENLLSESGRSMVEMLGVLAVMGVISIGVVATGFRLARDQMRANEARDLINYLVLGIDQEIQNDTELSCCVSGATQAGNCPNPVDKSEITDQICQRYLPPHLCTSKPSYLSSFKGAKTAMGIGWTFLPSINNGKPNVQINFTFPADEGDNTYLCRTILETIGSSSFLKERVHGFHFPSNLNWDANLWSSTYTDSHIKSRCDWFYTYHKDTRKLKYWGFQVAFKYNTAKCEEFEEETE